MVSNEYYSQEYDRVAKLFKASKHSCFRSGAEMADWYVNQLKKSNCQCFYCETSIHDINKLIAAGKLRDRKVRGTGRRGHVLEIDKKINTEGYVVENCVLACLYCNNDKSYTIDSAAYKTHFGLNRKEYHRLLLDQLTH